MTTDTAVRVTRIVIQHQSKSSIGFFCLQLISATYGLVIESLNEISYIDHPELRIDEHESTEMPFRYVRDESGNPVMPQVSPRGNFLSCTTLGNESC